MRSTLLGGHPGLLVGGQGGWIINHTLTVGGGGYGLVNPITYGEMMHRRPPAPDQYLQMGYGGVLLQYHFFADWLINGSVGVLIGAGGVGFGPREGELQEGVMQPFFVTEPEATVYLNVTEWMRVGAGVSYRYLTTGERCSLPSQSDLNGYAGSLALEVGAF
jgi:hypothetical protein